MKFFFRVRGRIACLLFLVLYTTHAVARPVSPEEALQVARRWMEVRMGRVEEAVPDTGPALPSGTGRYYHILHLTGGGWIIVAGDDVAYPVIAFSPTGPDPTQVDPPIQFSAWMETVSREIGLAIEEHLQPLPETARAWEYLRSETGLPTPWPDTGADVAPLLTTTWSQGTYYNAMCPEDPDGPDGHALVGCVATAMGQVMKYHNHPKIGRGEHTYTHATYGTLSADFGATVYQWSEMADTLDDYNDAVATLLYHAGVSVDMNYGPHASSAYVQEDVVRALKTYFRYSPDLHFAAKVDYSDEDWTALLRSELDNGRPVLYRGSGSSGGHAFVCDGYTGTAYFHFNWGWGGSYDGYFYLNDLTPGGYPFTDDQGGIMGVIPLVSAPDLEVQARSVSEQLPLPAAEINFTAWVENQGEVPAEATTLSFYLSGDADISVADRPIGSEPLPALAPNDSTSIGIAFTVPSEPGPYWIGACAPAIAGELNTTNNCSDGLPIVVSRTSLAEALDTTFLAWQSSGDMGWFGQTDTFFSDGDAARSGYLADNETSILETVVQGPGRLDFMWQVSSEPLFDTLSLSVDGEEPLEKISGEVKWEEQVLDLGPGTHTIRWTYAKDLSISQGEDCAWVDRVEWHPDAPDLIVENAAISEMPAAPGESFTYVIQVSNQGQNPAAQTILRYYRSTDPEISGTDTQIGLSAIPELEAGDSFPASAELSAPTSQGQYWIGACVDPVAGEADIGNNCSQGVGISISSGAQSRSSTLLSSFLPALLSIIQGR